MPHGLKAFRKVTKNRAELMKKGLGVKRPEKSFEARKSVDV